VLWLGSLSCFTLGIVLVVLGVHQAEMARDLSLDLAAFGLLGAFLALGFGAGLMAAGPLVERLPKRWLFACASALAGLALFGIDADIGYAGVASHLLLLGFGGGACVTLLNAATLGRYGVRAARALAIMHAASTAGATSGPWLIAWGQGSAGAWPRTFHALSALYFTLALCGALLRRPWASTLPHAGEAREPTPPDARLLSLPLFMLGLIGFAYIGVENGLTLFAVPWAESQGLAPADGRAAISAFWFGLMTGRLALAARRPAPAPGVLVACGAAGALAVGIALLSAWTPIVALAAAGLALGPVYPMMIALTGKHFARAPGTAVGLVSGAAASGGFVLPWLAGASGDALGVRFAVALLGGCACIIAAGALVLQTARRGAS
jgi:MFS transporter, FHS family, glucose/mannose:H+ symporter